MTDRPWQFPETRHTDAPALERLLQARGYSTPDAVRDFLHPEYEQISDPFSYRDMRKIVDRVFTAITEKETITIYGDYDVDGMTSTAILTETIEALGGQVGWYLPERLSEGYGLNIPAIEKLYLAGTKLLIAVDCGTTNVTEITWAKEHGLDVIVLDHHHQPAVLPPVFAMANPTFADETYPDRRHSSGGIAFTTARALLLGAAKRDWPNTPSAGWEKWLLDLVAISTIADMVPLVGENRIFAHFGLQVLRKTRRPGLRAMVDMLSTPLHEVNETTIGFQLAPRLNAAGRLQHASTALKLLLTHNRAEAASLARELDEINRERQQLTTLATAEAWEQVATQGEQSAFVAFAPHWSPGVLGLIAGRLMERTGRPVVVMTTIGEETVGSGRSIPGIDIMALFDQGADHFQRFGGHPGACGFTLRRSDGRESFSAWIQSAAKSTHPEPVTPPLVIDDVLTLTELTPEFLDGLEAMGPFGIGNVRPRFLISGVVVEKIRTVGAEGQHLRLDVRQGPIGAGAIGFRLGQHAATLTINDAIDIVAELAWNRWNGKREPQMTLCDWKPSTT